MMMTNDGRRGITNRLGRILLALILALPLSAVAGEAQPAAADPALEERMMALASQLRCLVCQNETLADSQAPLAADLRNQIREKMRQGASERDVINYLVARYGDFVLYRPPLKSTTFLLWIGPLLLLVGGLAALFLRLARRRADPMAELSDAERARAAELLGAGRDGEQR
jgi:cytochrome c-type biogenesis protein CcmH